MKKIRDVDILIPDQNENCLCYTLLFGGEKLSDIKNICILSETIAHILLTGKV